MAARRRDPVGSGFYPRDARGRFVALADYRPRDAKGRFKKLPKKLAAAVDAARRERSTREDREQARLAAERRERARNAALAGAAKRRRLRRESLEHEALLERQAAERRAFEQAEAERRRKIAEAEDLKAAERKKREAERKERAKQKRKERRAKEDAEIERLRQQQQEIEKAEKKRLEEEGLDAAKRHEQAVLDAEAEAEEERVKQAIRDFEREREREGAPEYPQPEPGPPVEVPEPGEPPLMEGAVVTPEEIMELALIELRDKSIAEDKLERTRTDPTLVLNQRTGSLGQAFRIETLLRQEGLAADIAEIAADITEQILGIQPGSRVYVSILLTEWGSADAFTGSIDKVIAWGSFGTLVQSWQGVPGASSPAAIRRGVLKLFADQMRHNPRAATLIEGMIIRGYKPGNTR